MPFKSQKKRRAYAKKWRGSHPRYMSAYYHAYVKPSPGAPSPLLGRRTNATNAEALQPIAQESFSNPEKYIDATKTA